MGHRGGHRGAIEGAIVMKKATTTGNKGLPRSAPAPIRGRKFPAGLHSSARMSTLEPSRVESSRVEHTRGPSLAHTHQAQRTHSHTTHTHSQRMHSRTHALTHSHTQRARTNPKSGQKPCRRRTCAYAKKDKRNRNKGRNKHRTRLQSRYKHTCKHRYVGCYPSPPSMHTMVSVRRRGKIPSSRFGV